MTPVLRAVARRAFEGMLDWPFPRPTVKGLVERDEGGDGDPEYLFVRQSFNGVDRWILPGGGVERGEDPRETVTREVREETGLDVTVGEPVDAYAFEATMGPHVATVFRCRDPIGELTVAENPDDEPIVEARWVPAGAVSELRLPDEFRTVTQRQC